MLDTLAILVLLLVQGAWFAYIVPWLVAHPWAVVIAAVAAIRYVRWWLDTWPVRH